MTIKMPRGAIPISRSDLAAAEPYRPEADAEAIVPRGEFPTLNQDLAAARPYRGGGTVPDSGIAWPVQMDFWGNDKLNNSSNSSWAEEAFAKACAEPRVFVPTDVVLRAARDCGTSNFAAYLQTHGFEMDRKVYVDGPFRSVDWTNEAALNGAIAHVGPVKIGIASANLSIGAHGQVTPGMSGWAIYGVPTGRPENHCASLCGYGSLTALVDLFKRHGVDVISPLGMPAGLCYAMFSWGSIGIVDRQSLMNVTGEAWVRNPTTIVKTPS